LGFQARAGAWVARPDLFDEPERLRELELAHALQVDGSTEIEAVVDPAHFSDTVYD
jgi:hypothetical protein